MQAQLGRRRRQSPLEGLPKSPLTFQCKHNLIAAFVVTVSLGIYVATQPGLYSECVVKLFSPKSRPRAGETIEAIVNALRFWLFGQLIRMAMIAVLCGFAVWMIELPSPVALGVIAGVVEFVPHVGPSVDIDQPGCLPLACCMPSASLPTSARSSSVLRSFGPRLRLLRHTPVRCVLKTGMRRS